MNRKLVIGDIHGGLKALKQVLERANVTQNDTLIFLGDYVDGWSESPEVLNFSRSLHVCIKVRKNSSMLIDFRLSKCLCLQKIGKLFQVLRYLEYQ